MSNSPRSASTRPAAGRAPRRSPRAPTAASRSRRAPGGGTRSRRRAITAGAARRRGGGRRRSHLGEEGPAAARLVERLEDGPVDAATTGWHDVAAEGGAEQLEGGRGGHRQQPGLGEAPAILVRGHPHLVPGAPVHADRRRAVAPGGGGRARRGTGWPPRRARSPRAEERGGRREEHEEVERSSRVARSSRPGADHLGADREHAREIAARARARRRAPPRRARRRAAAASRRDLAKSAASATRVGHVAGHDAHRRAERLDRARRRPGAAPSPPARPPSSPCRPSRTRCRAPWRGQPLGDLEPEPAQAAGHQVRARRAGGRAASPTPAARDAAVAPRGGRRRGAPPDPRRHRGELGHERGGRHRGRRDRGRRVRPRARGARAPRRGRSPTAAPAPPRPTRRAWSPAGRRWSRPTGAARGGGRGGERLREVQQAARAEHLRRLQRPGRAVVGVEPPAGG